MCFTVCVQKLNTEIRKWYLLRIKFSIRITLENAFLKVNLLYTSWSFHFVLYFAFQLFIHLFQRFALDSALKFETIHDYASQPHLLSIYASALNISISLAFSWSFFQSLIAETCCSRRVILFLIIFGWTVKANEQTKKKFQTNEIFYCKQRFSGVPLKSKKKNVFWGSLIEILR